MHTKSLSRIVVLACLTGAALSPAVAQKTESPAEARVEDPILVFNQICYGQVPDIQAIRDMATKLAWQPIKTEDLKKFTTIKVPRVLQGWDAQVGERIFRVAVVRATPPESMVEAFPDFSEGLTTTCSMVLDEGYEADLISANMQKLARKDPITKDVDDGLLRTTTWAGGNDKFKVFLVSKVGKHGKGGLISVTVLQKK